MSVYGPGGGGEGLQGVCLSACKLKTVGSPCFAATNWETLSQLLTCLEPSFSHLENGDANGSDLLYG